MRAEERETERLQKAGRFSIFVDPTKPVPVYGQLVEQIVRAIDQGALQPHDVLPSESELAERLGVSRGTVRQAYQLLQRRGALYRRRGSGSYVAPRKVLSPNRLMGFSEEMRQAGYTPASKTLRQEMVDAGVEAAEALNVQVGDPLFYLERLRLADGVPMAINQVWLPAGLCRALVDEDFEEHSLYEVLMHRCHVYPSYAEKTIEAVAATRWSAELLAVKPRTPLLLVRKIAYDNVARPVEFQIGYWRCDRYRFSVREERG